MIQEKLVRDCQMTLGEICGPFLVRENQRVRTILIWDELKKLVGHFLNEDDFSFVQEVFFAEKHKTFEDISIQHVHVTCSNYIHKHLDYVNLEKLDNVSVNFWAIINGHRVYKFSEEKIKNIEANLPEFY